MSFPIARDSLARFARAFPHRAGHDLTRFRLSRFSDSSRPRPGPGPQATAARPATGSRGLAGSLT